MKIIYINLDSLFLYIFLNKNEINNLIYDSKLLNSIYNSEIIFPNLF